MLSTVEVLVLYDRGRRGQQKSDHLHIELIFFYNKVHYIECTIYFARWAARRRCEIINLEGGDEIIVIRVPD